MEHSHLYASDATLSIMGYYDVVTPDMDVISGQCEYRGTSFKRKRTPLGPYRRFMPRVLRGS